MFKGSIVALITPINKNKLDEDTYISLIDFHLKNYEFDIVLPTLKFKNPDQKNIVKVVSNKNNQVMYLIKDNSIVKLN